jgi:hypothetical protein
MTPRDKIIDTIISVGKALAVNDEGKNLLSKLTEYNVENKIRIDDLDLRSSLIKTSDENLINFFKGLVIIGNYFDWGINSGSAAIFVYRDIMERKLDRDLKIADWAFINSHNPYIPFGSAGNIRYSSKDAYDYVRNSQMQYSLDLNSETMEKLNTYSSYLDQRTIEELKVDKSTLTRKIADLEEEITKLKTEKENLKLRLTLSKKSNIEKAQYIIENETRIIYFFSEEIEQIIADKKVPRDLLEQIKDKFNDNENKNNIVLKNRLINEINNR